MRAVLPVDTGDVDQPQVRLVDERGDLQCVPAPLLTHIPPGKSPQFGVHERRELFQRRLVTPAPRFQQNGDIA